MYVVMSNNKTAIKIPKKQKNTREESLCLFPSSELHSLKTNTLGSLERLEKTSHNIK